MQLMQKYDCSLEELMQHRNSSGDRDMFFSKGLQIQAHKMIEESKFKTAKEIEAEERKIAFMRDLGLIK